jgi:hypothetical protein
MTAFDRRMFLRMLMVTGVLWVAAFATVVLTDEPGSTTAMRLARMGALTPGLSAVAALLSLEQARDRGELRALAALGVSPWRAALGATLAGWLLGAIAVLLVASVWADPAALFPALPEPSGWRPDGMRLVDPLRGVAASSDGTLVLSPPAGFRPKAHAAHSLVAAMAVGAHAVLGPLWASSPLGPPARIAGFVASVALTVTLLHAFAAGAVGAEWLLFGAAPLGLQTAFGYGLTARRLARSS